MSLLFERLVKFFLGRHQLIAFLDLVNFALFSDQNNLITLLLLLGLVRNFPHLIFLFVFLLLSVQVGLLSHLKLAEF